MVGNLMYTWKIQIVEYNWSLGYRREKMVESILGEKSNSRIIQPKQYLSERRVLYNIVGKQGVRLDDIEVQSEPIIS